MKTCKHCQSDFKPATPTQEFCCAKCRVYNARAKSPSTELAPAGRATLKEVAEQLKVEPALAPSLKSSISGDAGIDAEIQKAIARTQFGKDAISVEEVRGRLFGFRDIKPIKHSGIKGYNEFHLSVNQPWHCTTIVRLAELLTMWGHDAMKWLKGEARGVGYVPKRAAHVELPQ